VPYSPEIGERTIRMFKEGKFDSSLCRRRPLRSQIFLAWRQRRFAAVSAVRRDKRFRDRERERLQSEGRRPPRVTGTRRTCYYVATQRVII
jgi:hypothetical protein